ncbi:MAG: hypothetical protein LUE63_03640 [Lachnospiraceae bacterium]|nr:hypothetical protein [Lachnospiraceae bacterium]
MLTLVLLKSLSDPGFYYAFAGFFALLAGAKHRFFWPAWACRRWPGL